MNHEPCPAGCDAPTVQGPEGTYFDEVWDEEHESTSECTSCGRIFAEDRFGEPVQVWAVSAPGWGDRRFDRGGDDRRPMRQPVAAAAGTGVNSGGVLAPDPDATTPSVGLVSP